MGEFPIQILASQAQRCLTSVIAQEPAFSSYSLLCSLLPIPGLGGVLCVVNGLIFVCFCQRRRRRRHRSTSSSSNKFLRSSTSDLGPHGGGGANSNGSAGNRTPSTTSRTSNSRTGSVDFFQGGTGGGHQAHQMVAEISGKIFGF